MSALDWPWTRLNVAKELKAGTKPEDLKKKYKIPNVKFRTMRDWQDAYESSEGENHPLFQEKLSEKERLKAWIKKAMDTKDLPEALKKEAEDLLKEAG